MKSILTRLLALAPIPVVVVLVLWAVKRPMPPPLILNKPGHAAGAGAAGKAVRLPAALKSGWKIQGKLEQYDKKTLFDRIDGAAPAYIRAGYAYSLGAEFRRPGMQESVLVDLYDMGSVPQGLGMYATERDSSYTFISVGQEGYLASGSLNFVKGRFYVKLAGFEDNEAMNTALKALAEGIVAALPEEGRAALAPLALLPAEGRAPNTDGYSLPPLADVEGLEQVFFTGYREGQATYRVFVVQCADEATATRRLDQVQAYFGKDGAKMSTSDAGGGKLLEARGESATTLVLRAGALLTGAVDLTDAALIPAARQRLLAVAQRAEAAQQEQPAK
ncbi:MAG: hypothetical protein KKB20_30555 [Proteobacteria bacterium]|nr:hypothetical protein [Pseudomonadota bacterium]